MSESFFFLFPEKIRNNYACFFYSLVGRVDILINNAGALWWKKVIDTPVSKYDLINQINSRATFVTTRGENESA